MAVELTRIEHVQIQVVRTLRKLIRIHHYGNDVSETFYVRDTIGDEEFPKVLKQFGVREMDYATHFHPIVSWPRKNDFRKAIHAALRNITSLPEFRVEFLLGSRVITTEYGDCVPVQQISIVHDGLGTTLFRYNPSEYLRLLRHLEGDNEGQNIHLLNALKFRTKE